MEKTITVSGVMNPEILDQFTEVLECEIELLQGKKITLPDGMIEFEVELTGYKDDIAKDFIQMPMSLNTQEVKIEIMGVPLNKN